MDCEGANGFEEDRGFEENAVFSRLFSYFLAWKGGIGGCFILFFRFFGFTQTQSGFQVYCLNIMMVSC